MALDLTVIYPGQVVAGDPDYPQGKARNVVVEGDGTGTPYEEQILNDTLGFQQALLESADITPNGVPDKATDSQYLDGVKWCAALSVLTINVQHPSIGASGGGVSDATAAFQAAVDALAPYAGGKILLPAGIYRITGAIDIANSIEFVGDGSATLSMDHATANWFSISGNVKLTLRGVTIEAAQVNTGKVVNAVSGNVDADFVGCTINQNNFHHGRLVSDDARRVLLQDTIANSRYVSSSYWLTAAYVTVRGGEAQMAPAATVPLIAASSRLNIDGVYFSQISTIGGLSYVDATSGDTWVENSEFATNDAAAGSGTTAVKVNGGRLHARNNTFQNTLPYEFAALAAAGSDLQLLPAVRIVDNGDDVTLPQGYERILVETDNVSEPNLHPADILFMGQPLTVVLHNDSGGAWIGNPTFVGMTLDDTALVAMPNNAYATVKFDAIDLNGTGVPVFVQSSAAGVFS